MLTHSGMEDPKKVSLSKREPTGAKAPTAPAGPRVRSQAQSGVQKERPR